MTRECTFLSGGHNWVVTNLYTDGETYEECADCGKGRFSRLPKWQREAMNSDVKRGAIRTYRVALACGAEYDITSDIDMTGGGWLSCRVHGDMTETTSVRLVG